MIISGNSSINKVYYNGYTISKIYACGGSLVWSGDTPTPPTPTGMKFNAVFSDASTFSAECDATSAITSGDFASHTAALSTIRYIEVGDCVTTIGRSTFKESAITGFSLSNSVTTIEQEAFAQCDYLTDVTLPSSITNIGGWAFYYCARIRSINIPSGVTSINRYTFKYDNKLTSCTIPNDSLLTSIGDEAFFNCTELTSINIPNSVRSFGSMAFAHCKSLTSINIPFGVSTLSDSLFNGCSGLTSVTVPSTVTSMGYSVFKDCQGLQYFEFQSQFAPTLASDGGQTFSNTNNCPIYVPDGSVEDYKTEWGYVADRIKPISEKP